MAAKNSFYFMFSNFNCFTAQVLKVCRAPDPTAGSKVSRKEKKMVAMVD